MSSTPKPPPLPGGIPAPSVATTPPPSVATTPPPTAAQRVHYCYALPGLWYYDHTAEQRYPPGIYSDLVSKAQKRLWVWDPHVFPADTILFARVSAPLSLRVLASPEAGMKTVHKDSQEFLQRLTNLLARSGVQVEMRCYDITAPVSLKRYFHDRYLFVDDEVYMVGASLSYHHRRTSSTALVHLQTPGAAQLLRERFEDCWKNPYTKLVKP